MPDAKPPATPSAAPPGAAPPPMTIEALNDSIAKSVQQGIAQGLSQVRQQEQQQAQARAAQEAAGKADPLRDALAPYVDPKVNQAILGSATAMDFARFYIAHPEAVKHQQKIEARFAQQMQGGNPLPREQVFNMLRGENFDEFMAERTADQQAAAARAAAAGTVGAGSGPHGVTYEDPFAMTHEALDAALSRPGVTF